MGILASVYVTFRLGPDRSQQGGPDTGPAMPRALGQPSLLSLHESFYDCPLLLRSSCQPAVSSGCEIPEIKTGNQLGKQKQPLGQEAMLCLKTGPRVVMALVTKV